MPERRVTLRILTPLPDENDDVTVEVLGAMTSAQFHGTAPNSTFTGETVADALAKLGKQMDESA